MQTTPPERRLPFNLDQLFRKRLGRLLLFCLLALTLCPMALIGLFSCRMAAKELQAEVGQRVRWAAEWEHHRVAAALAAGDLEETPVHKRTPTAATDLVGEILATPLSSANTYRSYLVDTDLTLLAGRTGGSQAAGEILAETEQTRLWRRIRADGMTISSPTEPFQYTGPSGDPVMGALAPIHLGSKTCALIVEVDMTGVQGTIDTLRAVLTATLILFALGVLLVSGILVQRILGPVRMISQQAAAAVNDPSEPAAVEPDRSEFAFLGRSVASLIAQLKKTEARYETQRRFIAGLTRLHQLIGGEQELGDLCLNSLEFLSAALDLSRADFYIITDENEWERTCRFPGNPSDATNPILRQSEALAKESARQQTSGWFYKEEGQAIVKPVSKAGQANLMTLPLILKFTVNGVLELEKKGAFSTFDVRFAEGAEKIISVALGAAMLRRQEKKLLDRSRRQSAKLRAREAALQDKTQELQQQTRALQTSEETLQLKQLELQAANAQMAKNTSELEAHMLVLEQQKSAIQKKNRELEKTHRDLAEKARQLEISSQYKTEFLANMSHELRTPLNSILLLSRLLLEDKEKNLTPKQSEFSHTIHSAGEDLLHLINEILDLAKVEAGKMEVEFSPVSIHAVTQSMLVSFSPLAEQSGVKFDIHVAPDVPEKLVTDRKRLEQIVKNFLSNAFKFTATGSIRLEIAVAPQKGGANRADPSLTISVVDTGIGIPRAKREMVFEAFQQVDGSIRRKYGGTGLGLSISRELAKMLGGEITLESKDGRGSRFTLHLPLHPLPSDEPTIVPRQSTAGQPLSPATDHRADHPDGTSTVKGYVPDDRNRLSPGDRCILIIESQVDTIESIQVRAHEAGYKVLVAEQFPTGLHFADYHRPDAIFLNLEIPGGKGWEMVTRLKNNPASRHVPVVVLSAAGNRFEAACHGAADYIAQPVDNPRIQQAIQTIAALSSQEVRTILVAAPDRKEAARIAETIEGPSARTIVATTSDDGSAVPDANETHAVIVHPAMVSAGRFDFLRRFEHTRTPVFHYPQKQLPPKILSDANFHADKLNLHGVETVEQLLASIVGSLHLSPDRLRKDQAMLLESMDNRHDEIKGRNVLLVDDDMRTVFAVSNVLEDRGARVFTGKTGKESLDKLSGFPDIDLVLMDVMISGVNGYQAIQKIREDRRHENLTIIALTAKAMQGDRYKCLQAGADDYLSKPVNLEKLTSMLKTWLELKRTASSTITA